MVFVWLGRGEYGDCHRSVLLILPSVYGDPALSWQHKNRYEQSPIHFIPVGLEELPQDNNQSGLFHSVFVWVYYITVHHRLIVYYN